MPLSEVFWVGFYSSMIGFILALGSQLYRSKCSKVDVGCIHITRDVEAEEELDRQQTPIPQNPIQSQARL
jgi:hypothetical protein